MSYKVLLQASGTGLLNEQRARAQQQNNEDRTFFSRLLGPAIAKSDESAASAAHGRH
jgi:hypothetical protein